LQTIYDARIEKQIIFLVKSENCQGSAPDESDPRFPLVSIPQVLIRCPSLPSMKDVSSCRKSKQENNPDFPISSLFFIGVF